MNSVTTITRGLYNCYLKVFTPISCTTKGTTKGTVYSLQVNKWQYESCPNKNKRNSILESSRTSRTRKIYSRAIVKKRINNPCVPLSRRVTYFDTALMARVPSVVLLTDMVNKSCSKCRVEYFTALCFYIMDYKRP